MAVTGYAFSIMVPNTYRSMDIFHRHISQLAKGKKNREKLRFPFILPYVYRVETFTIHRQMSWVGKM